MANERTLLIIKHDGVARGLMGSVIKRIENIGLKLVAMEFIQSTTEMGNNHYPNTEKWFAKVGERTLNDYFEKGIDPKLVLGTDSAVEIGKMVKGWLVDYLSVGPVLAMVWEGPGAVAMVRKLVGDTIPARAAVGTIRGDFGIDNPEMANAHQRPMYNIVHASGEVAEAAEEISLWFGNKEVFDYDVFASKYTGEKGRISNKRMH
jgi:nucleoside-diphosphate kinase